MLTATSLQRYTFIILSYFSFSILRVAAQDTGMQNATTVVSASDYTTSQPSYATDGDMQTAAVLRPAIIGLNLFASAATERIQFAKPIPAGLGSSYVYMQINKLANPILGNTLDISLLNSSTVVAYSNNKQVGSWSLGGLLSVTLLQESKIVKMLVAPGAEFNQLEIRLDGLLSGYSVNLYEAFAPIPPAPLPVQLVNFQGKAAATGAQLSWTTASELNNSHFTVERASSATATTFEALGQVAGAGTSSQAHSYQFADATAVGTNYYRLRQVDATGAESFSPVITVATASKVSLAAYPSPATSVLTVASSAGTHLRIFDQQGQLVRQTTLPAGAQTLDVSALAAGFYVLQDAESGQRLRIQKAE